MQPGFNVFAGLIKLRLSLGVTLSAVTGFFLGKNTFDNELFVLIPGVFLLSSGSAALNQYAERIQDSMMDRTKNRPLPSKKISEKSGLYISILLLCTGNILLLISGIIPVALGILNIVLYNCLYTSLKRRTVLAIVPGALVGAVVPLIGYTSAGILSLNRYIIIFSIFMFLWQFPHFWLILIRYGNEYRSAGFPTILNYLTEKKVKYMIFIWILFTTGFLLLSGSGFFDWEVRLMLIILNFIFILLFYRILFLKNSSENIRYAFILINSYSFLVMMIIITFSLLICG
jgi:protoheme IX farnesyltransferase